MYYQVMISSHIVAYSLICMLSMSMCFKNAVSFRCFWFDGLGLQAALAHHDSFITLITLSHSSDLSPPILKTLLLHPPPHRYQQSTANRGILTNRAPWRLLSHLGIASLMVRSTYDIILIRSRLTDIISYIRIRSIILVQGDTYHGSLTLVNLFRAET